MLLDMLAQHVFVPAWDRWEGHRARVFQEEVRRVLDAPLEDVLKFQLDRIRHICRHAYNHTEFYRERFDDVGLSDFEHLTWEEFAQIPALTKADLREQVNRLVSKTHQIESLRRSATGGTTSSPTTIYMDWPANDRRWAATYEWDRRLGKTRGKRCALLWGAPQDIPSHASWKSRLRNRLTTRNKILPSSPLDDERMAEYYRVLRRWQPRHLQAYPTPLAIFAEYLLAHELRLEIPAVSVTAEPLQPFQRDLITRAFGTEPYNWYGAREAGRIATECNHHDGLHINNYCVHVALDTGGDYAGAESGPLLITDLWNEGMPLIRYEIGDVGRIATEPCGCGMELPRIMTLEGRTADVFVNSRGQRIPGVALTNRVVKDNSQFRELQFIQIDIREFEVLAVPGDAWQNDASEQFIREQLSLFMQEPIAASISIVETIPREPSGKVRFCKNLMNCSPSVLN